MIATRFTGLAERNGIKVAECMICTEKRNTVYPPVWYMYKKLYLFIHLDIQAVKKESIIETFKRKYSFKF